jgi:MSHA biogenesis protein MshO
MKSAPNRYRHRGFTLVELIMVIVIMGAIGGMVSVFMKSPIDAYFDSARRAALTDVADTTVRRMARDIQRALPNSIRNPSDATNQCIEFIPTKTGGRYRAASDGSVVPVVDFLDFTTADSSFNMLGLNSTLPVDQRIVGTDVIAVYNLGISGSDAYTGVNTAVVSSVEGTPTLVANETKITLTAGKKFPLESGSSRFQVIPNDEKIVSFVCPTTIPGNLVRNSNYAYPASIDATTACPTGGAILAKNVTCTLNYSGSDLQRNALVSMVLSVTDSSSGEAVRLQHEVHVSNTP